MFISRHENSLIIIKLKKIGIILIMRNVRKLFYAEALWPYPITALAIFYNKNFFFESFEWFITKNCAMIDIVIVETSFLLFLALSLNRTMILILHINDNFIDVVV